MRAMAVGRGEGPVLPGLEGWEGLVGLLRGRL